MRNIVFGFLVFSILGLALSQLLSPEIAIAQTGDSANSISVKSIEDESLTEKIVNNLSESWPWYITRATGLIAALSLVILMLSGIGQITGSTYKLLDPIVAWASHRALGIVFGASVLIHVFSLLFDKFIKINLLDILIPWFSDFRTIELFGVNFGSIYLAFGIIAFYLSLLIIITSLTVISKKPYFWKIIHLLSYLVMIFVFIHALFIGTDLAHGWLRVLWIAGGIIILISSLIRLKRAFTT